VVKSEHCRAQRASNQSDHRAGSHEVGWRPSTEGPDERRERRNCEQRNAKQAGRPLRSKDHFTQAVGWLTTSATTPAESMATNNSAARIRGVRPAPRDVQQDQEARSRNNESERKRHRHYLKTEVLSAERIGRSAEDRQHQTERRYPPTPGQ